MSLSGSKILIVGINYAPESLGIAPYTTDMSEFLAEAGAHVTVLTGVPHYPEWRTDILRSAKAPHPSDVPIVVHRVHHHVPADPTVLGRARYEGSFLARGVRAARAFDPDVVIGVTPALAGGVIASRVASRRSVPFALVVQDLMGAAAAQSGVSGGSRVARSIGAVERRVALRADRVAVIAPGFARTLERVGVPPERFTLLRNHNHVSTSPLSTDEARIRLGWPRGQFLAVHTGNMGMKQGLENVIDAARLSAGDPSVRYVLVGGGSQRALLEARAEGADNITFVDPLDDDAYPDALAAADVLLLNERPGVLDMSLPSKLTSYFAAGRPVVAAVTSGGETAAELTRAAAAKVVDAGDPSALSNLLLGIAHGTVDVSSLADNGVDYARRELSREAAAARTVQLVDELLSTSNRKQPRAR